MTLDIGLHQLPRNLRNSDRAIDQRNCVFWAAFAIETSLAYNLGRPPSISEDHISANLPELTDQTALALHHINHRRIQGRILSLVYCVGRCRRDLSLEDKEHMIRGVQQELDTWKANLEASWSSISKRGYPLRYVGLKIVSQ